jgi:hypothetical protein
LSESYLSLSEWKLKTGLLRNKKWVSYFHRTAQPLTLAPFPAWGIQQELVVEDLPAAKVLRIFIIRLNF